MDQPLAQKYLDDVTEFSDKARDLLRDAGGRLHRTDKHLIPDIMSVASGWAALANTAAIAAQAAVFLPATQPAEEH